MIAQHTRTREHATIENESRDSGAASASKDAVASLRTFGTMSRLFDPVVISLKASSANGRNMRMVRQTALAEPGASSCFARP